jgi:hypothetical protein
MGEQMGGHRIFGLIEDRSDDDQRQRPRYRVLLSATLVTTADEQPVKLRDLSASGALIEGATLPAPGTDILIRRGGMELFATIAWRDGTRAGVEFDRPISDTQLWEQIHQAPPQETPVAVPDHRRPGFGRSGLSAEERRVAAAWANPAGRLASRA